MKSPPTQLNARGIALVFGAIPCVLGVGLGQYLRWTGSVWLTNASGFWPIFCFIASLLVCVYLALTAVNDRTLRANAWLMLTWTWLYFPFWLTAVELPRHSAVISKDGRAVIASEWVGPSAPKAWLFAGRGGNKIIYNVEGSVTITAVDVKYKFAESYISSRSDEEDLSRPLLDAITAVLAIEAMKPRSSRIALFEPKDAQERIRATVCRTIVSSTIPCPLKLTISPSNAAAAPGGLWSKHFTEQEAIDERHLPTLVSLLTQDNSRLVRKDIVYALFMEFVETAADLAKVARKPHLLGDGQFNALIERIITTPDAGNEALSLYASVSRLSQEQRAALREKAFREASVAHIIKQYGPGRIRDSELAQLSKRLRTEFDTNPELAILVLEQFGGRLPWDLRLGAVDGIVKARASHALSALRYLGFSSPLRAPLLRKVIAEANLKELDASLAHGKLDELLTPVEARPLIASVIEKSHASKEWLDFAARVLPVRSMTSDERKVIVDELLFVSAKSALEFVTENRRYLEPSDVRDVTRDYVRTIAPDFCLHLTHRNANRQIDYFNDAQIEIFQKCAQAK